MKQEDKNINTKEEKEEKDLKQELSGEKEAKKEAKEENKKEPQKDKKGKNQKKEKPEAEKSAKDEKHDLQEKLEESWNKYVRLSAEFDNYRKRTLKEKSDLLKMAGEDVIKSILPVIDDFERALESMEESEDEDALKKGVNLIYCKLMNVLEGKGLKEIPAKKMDFDTDYHDAVTKIPAPSEDMKGKVVDVVQKGYTLNNKVIRYSKVVVGE